MPDDLSTPCTAFAGLHKLASGTVVDVALAVKAATTRAHEAVLVFDDTNGSVVDLDLRGSKAEIISRLREAGTQGARSTGAPSGDDAPNRTRGRPRLGVIAREITLLPRHWEWLAMQPGGASQTLRRLVDNARRTDDGQTLRRAARERAYRFLSALAGDLPDYEEALRALFSGNDTAFSAHMAAWTVDVKDYALKLAELQTQGPVSA